MENKNTQIIIEEMKKHKLCRMYWSNEIEKALDADVTLAYEPVGDMGIYSKYFDFELSYCGEKEQLAGTTARMHVGITANGQAYDLQKAVAGKDCFHNITIEVKRGNSSLCSCKFRLWDDKKEEYCGEHAVIDMILQSGD